jgi:nitroimidazol reductase NimA-like FMN-containing flavoprotein (pyridoxamine 5'-phosphate oxidase superfamily)
LSETGDDNIVGGVAKSERTRVNRSQQRASYDRATVNSILDAGFLCHVGYQGDHGIIVIPTLYVRDGDSVILHDSTGAGMVRAVRDGKELTVEVTHLDGIVAARSHFHHSINYRSAVLFGTSTEITDVVEKLQGMELLVEHITPGRWDEARKPNNSEFVQTSVIRMEIEEASAKIRAEGPVEEPEDLDLEYWGGVIPVTTVFGTPEPDPVHRPKIGVPDSIRASITRWNVSK